MKLKELTLKIPEFCMSHWLLRIPLIIVFLQQGLQKIPVTVEGAESFDFRILSGGLLGRTRCWNRSTGWWNYDVQLVELDW